VTGGNPVESKNVAADEIRGRSIEGGDTREIAEGAVIVVPNGVPHWFKEISGPFTYYVVKVR
jgi:quercetin dioxygenase-like cupin family protein